MRHRLQRLLVLLLLVLPSAPALAVELALVMSTRDGAYAEFVDALRTEALSQDFILNKAGTLPDAVDASRLDTADWIIAAGMPAAEKVLALPGTTPLLVTLVSLRQYRALQADHPERFIVAIVLDQPLIRQLALVRAMLPGAHSLGMLLTPTDGESFVNLDRLAQAFDINPVTMQLSASSELNRALERVLNGADAFLAIPDPLLATPTATRTLLLSSFRHRRPVFAYSRAFVDAGALASVFSTPADNARDAIDWLVATQQLEMAEAGAHLPRHFDVAVNTRVARSLNIQLPDISTLRATVRTLEQQGVQR